MKKHRYPTVRRQSPEGPWDLGSSKQLFIDRRFIETSENIQLVVNPPVKRSFPAGCRAIRTTG